MPNFHQPIIVAHTQGELPPKDFKPVEDLRFVFAYDKSAFEKIRQREYFLKIFQTENSFALTETDGRFVLSGSTQSFKNYFKNLKTYSDEDVLMLNELKENAKNIFADVSLPTNVTNSTGIKLCPIAQYSISEKMKHFWVAVKITGSQYLQRELSQSGCFCAPQPQNWKEEGFFAQENYATPSSVEEVNLVGDYKNKLNQINRWYLETKKFLLDAGHKTAEQDASFLLPMATTSESLISCNLEGWRDFFIKNCAQSADWEIRQISLEILLKFKQIFADCFENIEIAPDGMSAGAI